MYIYNCSGNSPVSFQHVLCQVFSCREFFVLFSFLFKLVTRQLNIKSRCFHQTLNPHSVLIGFFLPREYPAADNNKKNNKYQLSFQQHSELGHFLQVTKSKAAPWHAQEVEHRAEEPHTGSACVLCRHITESPRPTLLRLEEEPDQQC